MFQTERLYVRLLTAEDFQFLHTMQSDPAVMRYVGGSQDEAGNRADLEKILSHYASGDGSFLVWAVIQRSDDALVGTCALIINEHDEHEIGYRLMESYWGNGFGLEVTEGLVRYAFEERHIDQLVAYVDKENVPSVRILDRSSFLFDKEYYNEDLKCTDRRYSLTRIQWSNENDSNAC